MRSITTHVVSGNPVNEGITLAAIDGPGPGGASHLYTINPRDGAVCKINFQMGGVEDNGVNGVTNEALLAVVIDRLRSFQAGPFACDENAIALLKCQGALVWLHKRTSDRMARGVEGKEIK